MVRIFPNWFIAQQFLRVSVWTSWSCYAVIEIIFLGLQLHTSKTYTVHNVFRKMVIKSVWSYGEVLINFSTSLCINHRKFWWCRNFLDWWNEKWKIDILLISIVKIMSSIKVRKWDGITKISKEHVDFNCMRIWL